MKHWTELNELETAIIRVGEFKNLFKLLVAGTENDVDIKVLHSAIYTMEGMIDDIDSTLYEKFQTVFDAVRDEDTKPESEVDFNFPTANDYTTYNTVNAYSTIAVPQSENQTGSTVQMNSSSEEDEAFKNLEKALKKWKPATPQAGFWTAFADRQYSYPSLDQKPAPKAGFLRCFSATKLKIVVDICQNESRMDSVD